MASYSLAGAAVVVSPSAGPVGKLAAQELARYLYLLTGRDSRVVDHSPDHGPAVVLESRGLPAGPEGDGFEIATAPAGEAIGARVTGGSERGVLYGVYALLEELGVGFYLGGDTFPDGRTDASLPPGFQKTQRPCFAVRGNLLHDNLLIGLSTWGLADYQFYLGQLARQRCNTFLALWYSDDSPEVWDEADGRFVSCRPILSTLTRPWGAVRPMRTAEFAFGSGDFFDEEVFSHPGVAATADPIRQRQEAGRTFAEATRYARRLGLDVGSGFSPPVGAVDAPADPTDPEVIRRFQERLRRYLERNPDLAYFVLVNHESGGCCGTAPPTRPGKAFDLLASQREAFQYLGHPRRIWEAIRFGRFAQLAYEVLQAEAPRVRLVLSGWGGDQWMRFADYCLAYDQLLPADVIFTCHDNTEASWSTTVSEAWGRLSPSRHRWAIPWVENDSSDCWSPQPEVEALRHLCPDALAKGCQGLLTMHWRTRDMEEEAGFAARFAWDPHLTPEAFYRRLASDAFGQDRAEPMAQRLLTLQRLGKRWTGVHATPEIAEMIFTGCRPPVPLELDRRAVAYLLPLARRARDSLATGEPTPALGVREFDEVLRRLEALAAEDDPLRLRGELTELRETIVAVRPRLIERGLTPAQFSSVDLFLMRAHHLAHDAGAQSHLATLDRLRADLADLRQAYVAEGRIARLERLDFLAATIDFVTHYDRVAMMLAEGGAVDQALQQAEALRAEGRPAAAAEVAAEAFGRLQAAGMREAVLALTRKLSTRGEWGILATVNIKPVAAYGQIVDRLVRCMPVGPPAETAAAVADSDVHVWWTALDRPTEAQGLRLYRFAEQDTQPLCLTDPPLAPETTMFLDRPGAPGRYRYAVSAIARNGWESPLSPPAEVALGPEAPGPRLVACQPPAVLEADRPFLVRVVVVGSGPVRQVLLRYRCRPQGRWRTRPMLRRFRHSYHAEIPADALRPGLIEFFVEAWDQADRHACWPATARLSRVGRAWTASVV